MPAGLALTQDDDEKKRVPKKEKKQKKPAAEDDQDDEDDDDCWSSCFFDLLWGLFTSSDDEVELVPDPVLTETGTQRLAPDDTTAAWEPESTPGEPEQTFSAIEIPEPPPFRNRLMLTGSLGWGMMGPSDVLDEYQDGAWRVEVNPFWASAATFQVGLALGYQTARGYPEFNYETSSRLDSPNRSKLRMFNAALRAGQYISPVRRSVRVYWGVGPSLFWVKESADLDVFSLPDEEFLGEETVSLEKWRIGGDGAFGMDWPLGNDARLGFLTRVYFIPWEGFKKESLTLDFIGKRTIVGFNIGVTIAYDRL